MDNPLVPNHVDLEHPVVRRSYSLFTPAIQVLVDTVRDWIDRRIKGGTIFGPSQFGKSSAVLNWLGKLLDERLNGSVQLILWVHQDHGSSTSPRSFFSRLLSAANEGAKVRRDAATVHHQLVERLIQLANRNSSRYVVLVIDEAQSMTQREWLWLVQLHATLEAEGVLLCVISIASLQFNEKPRELAMTGSAHAAARFMLFESQFHGMRSADEISYVLSGYDEDTEWPEGSRICFTAGLAPRAYAEGFRIGTYGAHLWATLHDCLPVGYGGPEDFPMQSIASAARIILLRVAGAGSQWEDCLTMDCWRQAVIGSGHTSLMSLVSHYAGHRSR
jgi:type II secretory pathway predicted ATPase ExeA